jgi:hypothetical protein
MFCALPAQPGIGLSGLVSGACKMTLGQPGIPHFQALRGK